MNKYGFLFSSFLVLLAAISACGKWTDVSPPDELLTGSKVFADAASANKAVIAAYAGIMNEVGPLNGALSKGAGLYVDELYRSTFNEPDTGFLKVTLSAGYRSLTPYWKRLYVCIKDCNNIIEGLQRSTNIEKALKDQFMGEALCLRAINYAYLVGQFGDVPLVIGTDPAKNAAMPRTKREEVLLKIIDDLKEATKLLPDSIKNNNIPYGHTRISKMAAAAFLARIYLYNEQWQEAIDLSTSVIGSGMFSLPIDLNKVFNAGSEETIFQLQPVDDIANTLEGAFFQLIINDRPAYEATESLLNSFESSDARKSNWLKPVLYNGQTYYGINKYKIRSGTPRTEYNILLRLAEQYLIRAEASTRLGLLTAAIDDLNTVRKRAQLTGLPASLTLQEVLVAVANERRHELFAEIGHRFFDLKRWYRLQLPNDPLWSLADQALRAKPAWQSYKNDWPIPGSEIKLNPALLQNDGY